jgi:enamine deaminase RidA (YjgF/YER057c/UK114 family)
VSGWLDPDRKTHTDTTSQTVGILKDLQAFLATQKLTMANVAMLRVYLGPDPAKDNKIDTPGMTAGYNQFFGTKEQPHIPARTTLQASLPSAASGSLVEMDMIVVRP